MNALENGSYWLTNMHRNGSRHPIYLWIFLLNKTMPKTITLPKPKPKSRGRPESRVLKVDASPEFLAKCIVTPIKKPKK